MATLNLPDAPSTLVWRLIKARLRADPAYDTAGIRLVFLDGSRESVADLASYQGPVVKVAPSLGRAAWFTEASQAAALNINIRAGLPVLDVEDVGNLQHALEATLNTIADVAFQQSLVDAGAVDGLILFRQPLAPSAPGSDPQNGLFTLAGQFAVEVERRLT